jgi:membrane protein implicated in regulation of membrane protease activity
VTLLYVSFAGLGCLYVVLAALLGHGGEDGGGGGHAVGAHFGAAGHDAGAAGHGGGAAGHDAGAAGHGGGAAGAAAAGHGAWESAAGLPAHLAGGGHAPGGLHAAGGAQAAAGPHPVAGGPGLTAHEALVRAEHGALASAAPAPTHVRVVPVAAARFRLPLFSPLALATFVAGIGGYGLIARYALGAGDGGSLALAVPAALATTWAVAYLGWRLAAGSRPTSLIRPEDLPGSLAEVTVPIPPGGVGEAVAILDGQRYLAPAREVEGGAVPRGATVTIIETAGPTLVVRARPVVGEREYG